MAEFIKLTDAAIEEPVLINISKIVGIGLDPDIAEETIVMIDGEAKYMIVKETFDEIEKFLSVVNDYE